MKKYLFSIPFAASLLILGAGAALAQAPAVATSDSHTSHHPASSASSATSAQQAPLSEGEITRWDPRTLRLTLKHGEIKNLEMPPMTMVFRVQDASVLGDLKPGDKVRFQAEQANGAYHVKQIEKAP
ncbi:MAG: copper-binding protein [Acidovorax sp.]|nr:copper-binding protein [Acidovorax sp.]